MRALSLPELLYLADRLGTAEVCDDGLLDLALADPRARAFCEAGYPDAWHEAAALLAAFAASHINGNERIAWSATWVCLQLSGHRLAAAFDVDKAERLVVAARRGQLEVAAIAAQLTTFAEREQIAETS